VPRSTDIPRRQARAGRAALRLLALGAALLFAPAARAGSDRLILATHDAALASALSVAVSPRGLSVMELEAPLTRVTDAAAARRHVEGLDAVAVVWLCDDDAGAHGLCFCARDGQLTVRPISVTSPLAPPDAAALALSVKVLLGPASPASAPQPAAPTAPAIAPLPPAAGPPPPEHAAAPDGRVTVGLTVAALPGGTISIGSVNVTGGAYQGNASVAAGVTPFVDYALTPYVAVGLSPQLLFNVEKENDTTGATELDLLARLSVQVPAASRLVLFGRFSPGYSIVMLPSSTARAFPGATAGNPHGLVLDVSGGAAYLLSARLFLLFEAGYQLGLQRSTIVSDAGDEIDADYRTIYPHIGLGFGVALGR
jgi:hypothetical protein